MRQIWPRVMRYVRGRLRFARLTRRDVSLFTALPYIRVLTFIFTVLLFTSLYISSSCPSVVKSGASLRSLLFSSLLSCHPFRPSIMSSASQEEVASGSTSSDVIPKFDMHVIPSVMTEGEVRDAARLYGIPLDLNPQVPPPGMTMDRLPRSSIGIYEAYLEFSGVRVPFSIFLLQVIYYFRVHLSQLVPIGLPKVILFELYCRSLGFAPYLSLFRLFYALQKQGHWFSFRGG
ncbi:transposase (putative), gypsy type [Artemisia annua]|uniref:Transposase (Putative), gypsy type n=1 Tax=Artemisia annua TaxID=35608 RepID=A0A2U1NLC1_ARTAN|nr:transposase (putative), gypsy type [Artemisia annua]